MTSTGQRSSGVLSPPGTSRTRPPAHARIALPAIIGVESWERFSFYGMQAIMVHYLYAATADGGLGLSTATATALMGAYGSLVYLCTIAGGWIGDRVLGAERTLLAGAWVLVAGHLTLSLVPGTAGVAIGMVFVAAVVWLTATGILHLQRLPTVMLAATMAATVALFAQMLLDPDIERAERRRVLAFIPLFIAAVAFWSIHNQAFGALAVYSDLRIDRTIGDWTAPSAWPRPRCSRRRSTGPGSPRCTS